MNVIKEYYIHELGQGGVVGRFFPVVKFKVSREKRGVFFIYVLKYLIQ